MMTPFSSIPTASRTARRLSGTMADGARSVLNVRRPLGRVYHPGDMNDAWKIGHSGVSPTLAKAPMNLGINIIYHAFTHYLELTRKYRKK